MTLHIRAPRSLTTVALLILVLLGVRSLPLSVATAQDKGKEDKKSEAPKDVQLQLELAHKQLQLIHDELQRVRGQLAEQAGKLDLAIADQEAWKERAPWINRKTQANAERNLSKLNDIENALQSLLAEQHVLQINQKLIQRKLDRVLRELANLRGERK